MKHFYFLLIAITALSILNAQPPVISFPNQNVTGLTRPLDIVNTGDGSSRMVIVEKVGTVLVWDGTPGTAVSTMVDLSGLVGSTANEEGLLSIAFHPDYDGVSNRYFFVYYNTPTGNIRLSRLETTVGNPNVADIGTLVTLLTISHPGQTNHNGGKLNFGPDGYLYFATGDGGGSNDPNQNAQNGASLLGKMLRIDVDVATAPYYAIPPTNPYVADPAIADEIWALGLRNPFRWSFDRANGNMWIGDVGQGQREEINFRTPANSGGVNYGWRCYEGNLTNSAVAPCTPSTSGNIVYPVYEYNNPAQGRAVTGGFVYRGPDYPNMVGYYISVDYVSGNVFILWPNGSGGFNSDIQTSVQTGVTAFGENENGRLYALTGATLRLVVGTGGTPLPVTLANFTGERVPGINRLKWSTSFEQNTARFLVEVSKDGSNFNVVGNVSASRNTNGSNYSFDHYHAGGGKSFYRLAIEDDDGSKRYSNILTISEVDKFSIYPSVIYDRKFTLNLDKPAERLRVIGVDGISVFDKILSANINSQTIFLPSLAKGIYIVQVISKEGVQKQKILIQ